MPPAAMMLSPRQASMATGTTEANSITSPEMKPLMVADGSAEPKIPSVPPSAKALALLFAP